MDYKLICIDMDGTLLNNQKNISRRNIEAINKAHNKGVKVVVCTGRIFTSADFFADLLKVKAPVIASNGAYIKEKDRDEVIYKGLLGHENCMKLLRFFKKYNIYPHYYTTDTILTEKIIHSSYFYTLVNDTLPEDKKIKIKIVEDWNETFEKYKNEIVKGVAVDDDINKIKDAKTELCQYGGLEVVSSRYNNFEVMNKGVSKGKAVEILASYYNLKREEIICIGDSENDLSMIKYAGLGVAMSNGDDIVKETAKYITDSNNEDGVAKVIEKFVLA